MTAELKIVGAPAARQALESHYELIPAGTRGRRPGVYWVKVSVDGKGKVHADEPAWVCSPIRVAAWARDNSAQQRGWGELVEFTDLDGVTHRLVLPQSDFARRGDELRARLLDEGLLVTTDRRLRERLDDYLQTTGLGAGRVRTVPHTGWHGDAYVSPDRTMGGDTKEPLLFLPVAGATVPDVHLGTHGTLAGWIEHVATPCAGNSRLVLALSAAFAATTMGLVDAEGGGIHFRGATSIGKSTALGVACSVFGRPDAYCGSWRVTDNGLEGIAAAHSDMLLALDELHQLAPRHAGEVAYLLANGQGKGRSDRRGAPRSLATWRVLFLSTGEAGLADLITQGGGRVHGGQEVRVLDVPADAGAGFGLFERVAGTTGGAGELAKSLKTAAAEDYGHAFPAFLAELAGDPTKARETLRALQGAIAERMTPRDAASQVRRAVDRFALIGAAGELATACGLTGWPTGEAEHAARRCFADWLFARGGAGDSDTAAMLAQVRAFLEANGESRFTSWYSNDASNSTTTRTINRAGFRRDNKADGPTYYVLRQSFRRDVCDGYDPAAVAKVLAAVGALRLGSDGETTRKERMPDGTHGRVYVITPAVWDDGGDTEVEP